MVEEPLKFTNPLNGQREIMMWGNGTAVMVRKPKYANGRHLVFAGNRCVLDEAHPYWHGEFPYITIPCYKFEGQFWPGSMVANLISPQMELNRTLGQLHDARDLTGNPMLLADEGSINEDMMVAEPGLIVWKVPGSDVEFLLPPSIPNYIKDLLVFNMQAIDNISGIHKSVEGKRPTGIQSGVALQELNDAANTRIRFLGRHYTRALQRYGKMKLKLEQQFMQEARLVRLEDQEGKEIFQELTPEIVRAQWDVRVAVGSTLPRSRDQLQREAIELGSMGYFDKRAVLDHVEHPKARVIAARLEQQEKQAMDFMLKTGQIPPSQGQQ